MNDSLSGDTALLVIDVQSGLFGKSTPIYKAEELLTNITALVERAHEAGVPVIYVQHNSDKVLPPGSADWQLHPRLHPLAGETIIQKHHGSAFMDTTLGEELQSKSIRRLVITGLVTHGCVRAACQDARKLGYEVTLVSDGHSSYSKDAATLIEELHKKLGDEGVIIKPAAEITF